MLALFQAAVFGGSGSASSGSILAIVDDRLITSHDVRRRLARMGWVEDQNNLHQRQLTQELRDRILQTLIDETLIVRDFHSDRNRRLPETVVENTIAERMQSDFGGDRERYHAWLRDMGWNEAEYRQAVRDELIVGWMRHRKRSPAATVSPVQLENYYTAHRDRFFRDDAVLLRVIRLSPVAGESPAVLQQLAASIVRDVRNGGDFAALAKRHSQDTHRAQAGSARWVARSDLRPELAEVAFALPSGTCSEPVALGTDWFILQVAEHQAARVLSLDEVRTEIEQTLRAERAQQAEERWLERLRREAFIRYPALAAK